LVAELIERSDIASPITGNPGRMSSNEKLSTGNSDRITGNAECITGNAERITGNLNCITGDSKRSTGNTRYIFAIPFQPALEQARFR
jgi:hypothetical protein